MNLGLNFCTLSSSPLLILHVHLFVFRSRKSFSAASSRLSSLKSEHTDAEVGSRLTLQAPHTRMRPTERFRVRELASPMNTITLQRVRPCLIVLTPVLQPAVRVPPPVCENILRNRFSLEPTVTLVFAKTRPQIEVLACQEQVQSCY